MSSPVIHRWFNGSWNICKNPESCRSAYHFDSFTLAEARALPTAMLEALIEAFDPPVQAIFPLSGYKNWEDERGTPHRGYDLPAAISSDGYREWDYHGDYHRGGDKPARIWADGSAQWWKHGNMHRAGDKPAFIDTEGGFKEYWLEGVKIKRVKLS